MSNNNFMQMMQGNPQQIMQEFQKFRQGLNGDPQQQIMQMVQSGQISQQQLNQAQQIARRMMQMLGSMNG